MAAMEQLPNQVTKITKHTKNDHCAIQFSQPQEAQARFARARLCLPYNKGRKETLRPK
jgi:hypothetical protein